MRMTESKFGACHFRMHLAEIQCLRLIKDAGLPIEAFGSDKLLFYLIPKITNIMQTKIFV